MGEFEDRLNGILNDPSQMDKIANIAKSLMGGDSSAPAEEKVGEGLSGIFSSLTGDGDSDLSAIKKIGRMLSTGGERDNEERALLEAMKPYLSEKRRTKMDKAIKIARLAKIARFAMGEMGEDDNV